MSRNQRIRTSRSSLRFELIGVGLILISAVLGLIAYNANTGLPLQSTYRVTVEVPDADRLIKAADVRVGGVRVGEVLSVAAARGVAGASPYARLELVLDP